MLAREDDDGDESSSGMGDDPMHSAGFPAPSMHGHGTARSDDDDSDSWITDTGSDEVSMNPGSVVYTQPGRGGFRWTSVFGTFHHGRLP